MSRLPEHLRAAYDWIDMAGEWSEALADPAYAAEACANAVAHDQADITECALDEVIEWYRAHAAPKGPRL